MPKSKALQEGKDYYIENGLFVFTEHYLEKRGYCCQSGCRHCPYGFRKDNNKGGEHKSQEDS
ncbi:MAG: hypothetical protein H6558_10225 [Lewinellaceae bacterium]|nr:hypothetical protein [Lewinellaceae bacterium]MCB9288607.1 hypothetical protein [Lewinellaceae bacterium]